MNKEIEIEFKNLLTEEEYNKIYKFYNLDNVAEIQNFNYYYETKNEDFRKNNCALRVRHTNNKKEMTLKIQGAKQNIEINVPLEAEVICNEMSFENLPEEIKKALVELNICTHMSLTQKIETSRREFKVGDNLLVLDKTYFLDGTTDYELEFEVTDYKLGLAEFNTILEKLEIKKREALPKIARATLYTAKQQ